MPSKRRRSVDPIRVHFVTLAVYGTALGIILFVVLFPKAVLFLALMGLAAWLYSRLYAWVEKRLELLEWVEEEEEPVPSLEDEEEESERSEAGSLV